METSSSGFVRAGTFEELQAKGRLVVHGRLASPAGCPCQANLFS